MVHRCLILLGIAGAAVAPALGTPDLEDCLAADAVTQRVDCVRSRLTAIASGERLQILAELLDSHADTLAQILEDSPAIGADRADRGERAARLEAARLDLLGRAQFELGRLPEAAAALTASLALDDGTLRVDWRSADRGSSRPHVLASGNGRLQRAARMLLASGQTAAARTVLARVLAMGDGGWAREAWSGPPAPGLDAAPTPLDGPLWREPLPELTVQLYGGKQRRLKDARGNVLLLDFWASWCQPCVRELPFIEALYQSRAERGLEVLAINYHEEPQAALGFAQAMGLTLPVGLADRDIERALEIRSMPTVIVADREGRIRGRWAGYEDDVEEELTALIDELLDAGEAERVALGQVVHGAGALDVNWVRVSRRDLDGLAIVRTETGPRVAVSLARSLTLFDAEGREDRVLTRPPSAATLRTADLDGDGVDEVLGFRPGSPTVVVFDLIGKTFRHWEAPHPVFDVQVARLGDGAAPAVMLGTLQGLWRAEPDGSGVTPVQGFGTVSGVSAAGNAKTTLTVLESGKRLHWLDSDLAIRHGESVPDDAWRLVDAPGLPGTGVAPVDVASVAVGRFLRGGGRQIAYGLSTGQLVIVDAATGESRFRALLSGPVSELAGGDLNGDGLDELALIQGRNLALLRAAEPGGTQR